MRHHFLNGATFTVMVFLTVAVYFASLILLFLIRTSVGIGTLHLILQIAVFGTWAIVCPAKRQVLWAIPLLVGSFAWLSLASGNMGIGNLPAQMARLYGGLPLTWPAIVCITLGTVAGLLGGYAGRTRLRELQRS